MSKQNPEGRDSIAKAEAFLDYCRKNPSQRFWQALTNWAGLPYLGWAESPDGKGFRDLWHHKD